MISVTIQGQMPVNYKRLKNTKSHSFLEAVEAVSSHFAFEILISSQPRVWETPINSNAC
jgi:hypothetical protein